MFFYFATEPYKGSQRLIDEESGEVIEVDKLYRKQTSGNFVKAYIVQLISMLDMIGGKNLKSLTIS
ncbi:TPA: replication/maintenance protein RepL [Staphylococcus aureus]|nr:replication/maintenance protein RepL [Staphylococcus aureus]